MRLTLLRLSSKRQAQRSKSNNFAYHLHKAGIRLDTCFLVALQLFTPHCNVYCVRNVDLSQRWDLSAYRWHATTFVMFIAIVMFITALGFVGILMARDNFLHHTFSLRVYLR